MCTYTHYTLYGAVYFGRGRERMPWEDSARICRRRPKPSGAYEICSPTLYPSSPNLRPKVVGKFCCSC